MHVKKTVKRSFVELVICSIAIVSFITQPDASLSGIGLYRLVAEDSDDSLLASVSVAGSLPILLPYLSSAYRPLRC